MAYIHFHYKSGVLHRDVSMEITLPYYESAYTGAETKFKTVYLLHGHSGSAQNYMTRLPLRETANANGLAIVAINGENLAYLDCECIGTNFSTWIGTELLDVTRELFPLSDKREDTFIAGFSMGGYGSMVNGIRFADRFGKIGVLAGGGLNFVNIDDTNGLLQMMSNIVGGKDKYLQSYAYVPYAIEKACKDGIDMPKIYMACGTADPLYEDNVAMHDCLTAHNIFHTFTQYPDEGHSVQFTIKALPELFENLAQI